MDANRFDDLTVALNLPRRPVFRAILAGGGLLLGFRAPVAAGGCKAPGRRCREAAECCTGGCNRRKRRCRGCPSGQKFCNIESACIPVDECCGPCPTNFSCCTNVGICVNTFDDPDFCGGCTFRCQGADVCVNGDCANPCTGNGNCASDSECATRVDPDHAGERVCAELGVFTCDNVQTCANDNTCGFRRACVSGLCAGKNVCADPRD